MHQPLLKVLVGKITHIFKDRYKDLNADEIKLCELESDIKAIERLIDGVSYKKEKIAEKLLDEYVKAYEQEFWNQEKVIAND